ncbi:hypothetical protein [Enterococcus cecorum]|uniref:hypothetical protein n=1 Tax=Enterococcus cecorum TaxID=44008 RepID=UPI003F91028E
MIRNEKIIQEITIDKALKIIDTREPLGLFWVKDGGKYVAIDNTTGDAWTEEFTDKKQCMYYLLGYDI